MILNPQEMQCRKRNFMCLTSGGLSGKMSIGVRSDRDFDRDVGDEVRGGRGGL